MRPKRPNPVNTDPGEQRGLPTKTWVVLLFILSHVFAIAYAIKCLILSK